MSASFDSAAINSRLAAAERLLASGSSVADETDLQMWRASRDLWLSATAADLRVGVEESVVRSFLRAATAPPPEGSVSEDLPLELEALRQGMAVLVGVRARQQPPQSAPPDDERRGPRLGP